MNAEVLWAWSLNETYIFINIHFRLISVVLFLLFQFIFGFSLFLCKKKVSRVFPFKFSYTFFNHKKKIHSAFKYALEPNTCLGTFSRLVFLLILIEVQKNNKIKWNLSEKKNPKTLITWKGKKIQILCFVFVKRKKKRSDTEGKKKDN